MFDGVPAGAYDGCQSGPFALGEAVKAGFVIELGGVFV